MKKLFLLAAVLVSCTALFAQSANSAREEAKKTTDLLIVKYGLDVNQEMQMQQIQERKVENARSFEYLKNSDEKLYYKKKQSNIEGTNASIKRMLNPEQLKIYQQDQLELRKRRAEKSRQLKSAGVSGFELEKALIDIE